MDLGKLFQNLLGLGVEPKDLTVLHVALRSIIVFIATLIIVRVGSKRFLSRMSAFDAIVGFILASVLARAVNGSAAFFPTLAGGFVLVLLHRLLARAAFRWKKFEDLVKGHTNQLMRDGRVDPKAMRAHNITQGDLYEEMRLHGNVEDARKIQTATLERSGEISVVKTE